MKKIAKKDWLFLGICLLAVFSIYGLTLFGDFVFDDRGILDHEALLGDFGKLHKILSMPYWTEEAGLYRPITLVSYSLNFLLLGRNPWGFHLINLLFYFGSCFLIFVLISKLFNQKILSYLAALFFLVLPIHTEVVANITGRAEILALFFSLLALNEILSERPRFVFLFLWPLLALGSKETAVVLFPLALFFIYLKEKNNFFCQKTIKIYLVPFLAFLSSLLVYFGARFLVLGHQYFSTVETTIVENPLKFTTANFRLATALKITLMYFKKTFWPFNLCSDYSFNQIPIVKSWFNFGTLGGLIIVLGIIFIIIFYFKRQPILSLAGFWWLISFFLVSNFFFPIGTIAGERLVYFASLGAALFLGWIFSYFLKKYQSQKICFWSVGIFAIIILVFYSVLSLNRSADWLTEKRLFESAARCAPNSVLSLSNLGAVYYLEGDLANAKKWLLAAQEIYPDYPKGVNNLGLVYWREGDYQKARELFLRALSYRFPFYGAYENLALLALSENNIEEAKKWLREFYQGDERAVDYYLKAYFSAR